jgi:hypothetical protein
VLGRPVQCKRPASYSTHWNHSNDAVRGDAVRWAMTPLQHQSASVESVLLVISVAVTTYRAAEQQSSRAAEQQSSRAAEQQSSRAAEHYAEVQDHCHRRREADSRGARRCRSTTSSDAQVHEHYETCRTTAIVVTSLALEEHAVADRLRQATHRSTSTMRCAGSPPSSSRAWLSRSTLAGRLRQATHRSTSTMRCAGPHCLKTHRSTSTMRCAGPLPEDAQAHEHYEMCRTIA